MLTAWIIAIVVAMLIGFVIFRPVRGRARPDGTIRYRMSFVTCALLTLAFLVGAAILALIAVLGMSDGNSGVVGMLGLLLALVCLGIALHFVQKYRREYVEYREDTVVFADGEGVTEVAYTDISRMERAYNDLGGQRSAAGWIAVDRHGDRFVIPPYVPVHPLAEHVRPGRWDEPPR